MSLFITLAADVLVAVLLVATIATSVRLSRRITGLKADEAAMRRTVSDLVGASATAERAIAGLRAAIGECDRGLSESLDAAEGTALKLAAGIEAGDAVIARIGAIVAQAGTRQPAAPAVRQQASQQAPFAARREAEPVRPVAPPPAVQFVAPGPAAPGPGAPKTISNGERLDVARAAAQAMSERALDRLRARAA